MSERVKFPIVHGGCGRSFVRIALIVVVAAGAGGCTPLDDYTSVELSEPTKRHPIGYMGHTEALFVEIPAGGAGLSQSQQVDVWRFVDRYKKEGSGPLRIAAPGSAGGHLASSRSVRDVQRIVREAGIDPGAVQIARQHGGSKYGPSVRLAYERPVAIPPECRNWSSDLGENRERLPYNDFGCATQRNLVLTVANSRDLQVAQEETPRSSERRGKAWESYAGSASKSGEGSGGIDPGFAPSSMAPSGASP